MTENHRHQTHIVTGAFGYTGSYIAQELLNRKYKVLTLSNAVGRKDLFEGKVEQYNFNFNDKHSLINVLEKGSVLYNTYWVRFNHKNFNFNEAIENSQKLFEAAKEANIEHIVHISVTNADKADYLPYFKGKHDIEKLLEESGLSYTILRPALIYGKRDILVNNIAWMLRNFPFFGIFGDGSYKVQPIEAEELASICVNFALEKKQGTFDAVGPEIYHYKDFVKTIATSLNIKKGIIPTPPTIAYLCASLTGIILKDKIVTRDEITGLMNNLLYTGADPIGKNKFSEWIKSEASTIGLQYSAELHKRKYNKA